VRLKLNTLIHHKNIFLKPVPFLSENKEEGTKFQSGGLLGATAVVM